MLYAYIVFSAIDRKNKGIPGLWAYLNKVAEVKKPV